MLPQQFASQGFERCFIEIEKDIQKYGRKKIIINERRKSVGFCKIKLRFSKGIYIFVSISSVFSWLSPVRKMRFLLFRLFSGILRHAPFHDGKSFDIFPHKSYLVRTEENRQLRSTNVI